MAGVAVGGTAGLGGLGSSHRRRAVSDRGSRWLVLGFLVIHLLLGQGLHGRLEARMNA